MSVVDDWEVGGYWMYKGKKTCDEDGLEKTLSSWTNNDVRHSFGESLIMCSYLIRNKLRYISKRSERDRGKCKRPWCVCDGGSCVQGIYTGNVQHEIKLFIYLSWIFEDYFFVIYIRRRRWSDASKLIIIIIDFKRVCVCVILLLTIMKSII